ncbi:alpha/beta fold hydrolase [Pseudonocardia pini]|uniref:alpha/beta fold hydrolase n=1 Tax=Pseudonocardia pini TaxID=2758030 RepID=UPI001FE50D4E|nr:alpha/beta hydrolase [Pseudonocardia pini]
MWRPVTAALAEHHTVVAPDLRGYGESDRPPSGEDHAGYSFRAMAADPVAVMAELGFERFAVVGHDRGARTAHRLTLDHPERVERLALLDIMPTDYVYATVDRRIATAYYHWFLYVQPADLPERLIAGDPIGYLHALFGSWGSGLGAHSPEALAAYEKAFADPAARHAMLEDYRAGASIDLEHDAESERAGHRIRVPTLVLWGAKGAVGGYAESPVDVWRTRAADPGLVEGAAIPKAGHFLVEENTAATIEALRTFLRP